MATFSLNMFGTTHRNTTAPNPINGSENFLLFNLHILQVEYTDIVLSSFDMFIEFFAYPYNQTNYNLTIIPSAPLPWGGASIGTQVLPFPTPGSRRGEIRRPQIIHLTATTPTSSIDLYNCGFTPSSSTQLPTNGINPCTQPIVNSPCPSPTDFRLFSMTHYVKLVYQGNVACFDPSWTDMKSTQPTFPNSIYYVVNKQVYKLPIKVVIIANGCKFEKSAEINVYPDWFTVTQTGDPFGGADCANNPLALELGYNDKVIIT
jgi:hypothetical protein